MAKQTFSVGQTLTAAQMTSLQQTAMLGGAASAKTASYTLVAADAGGAISMSNASATTITVNTALFAAGDTVHITNLGAGVCTITAGTATVNSSASLALAQYESGFLDFTSTSAAIFVKGAGAAAASGGMTLLSTTTLSGTSTTISSIDQTYKDLFLIMSGITSSGINRGPTLRPNNSTTDSSYCGVRRLDSTSAQVIGDQDAQIELAPGTETDKTSAENVWAITFNNYASTTTNKPFSSYGEWYKTGSNSATMAGAFTSNTAITSLVFGYAGDTMTGGTVLLYGVK